MDTLLCVKQLLQAGYPLSSMKQFSESESFPDDEITKQIHLYKKRILCLEFIQDMRAMTEELNELSQMQLVNAREVVAKNRNLPRVDTEECTDYLWNSIGVLFNFDYFCDERDFEDKIVQKHVKDTFEMIEKLGVPNNELTGILMSFDDITIEKTQDYKDSIKEKVDELSCQKEVFLRDFIENVVNHDIDKMDEQSGIVYKKRQERVFSFFLDYIMDEYAIYSFGINLLNLASKLDRESLAKGKIKFANEPKKMKSKRKIT